MIGARFLVWSIEHDAWWGPGRAGYVRDVRAAGRYSRDDAVAILDQANVARVNECAIPTSCVDEPPMPDETTTAIMRARVRTFPTATLLDLRAALALDRRDATSGAAVRYCDDELAVIDALLRERFAGQCTCRTCEHPAGAHVDGSCLLCGRVACWL